MTTRNSPRQWARQTTNRLRIDVRLPGVLDLYVVNHGSIRFSGTPDELSHDALASEYIGGSL